MSYHIKLDLLHKYDKEYLETFDRPINNNSAKLANSNTIGISTGYCVTSKVVNELLLKKEIIDINNNNTLINHNVECCLHLLKSDAEEGKNTGGDCFLHTKEWLSESYGLLCGNIRDIYDETFTDFSHHCHVDGDCPDSNTPNSSNSTSTTTSSSGTKCVKYLSKFGSQLTVLKTSSQKNNQKILYFIGSPLQLVHHTSISAYRLRNYMYEYIHIDKMPYLHNFALTFRSNIVMYLKLLIQINLSSALMNSLPIIHLDGGQILPHILRIYLPRYPTNICV